MCIATNQPSESLANWGSNDIHLLYRWPVLHVSWNAHRSAIGNWVPAAYEGKDAIDVIADTGKDMKIALIIAFRKVAKGSLADRILLYIAGADVPPPLAADPGLDMYVARLDEIDAILGTPVD